MNIAQNKIIDPRYKIHQIKKSDGKMRTLTVPNDNLMRVQKSSLKAFAREIPVHSSATGFTEKKSVITNALIHRRNNVFWMFDIKTFFDSITLKTLKKYVKLPFVANDWSHYVVKREITSTSGYKKTEFTLTQGSPTSPFLSNAVMYEFDKRATRYFNKMGITYTRYADDITLSQKEYVTPKDADLMMKEFGETIQGWLDKISFCKLELKSAKSRCEILTDENPVKVVGIFIRKENRQHRNNYLATGKTFNEQLSYLFKRYVSIAKSGGNDVKLAQALHGKINWFKQVNRKSQKPYNKMMRFLDKQWSRTEFKVDYMQYIIINSH